MTPQRRALSHIGGPIVASSGPAAERALLAHAMDVRPDDPAARAHVHGFHSYPARLHPVIARKLIEGLGPKGAAVLDPFCGSGTVLVEARLHGCAAIGVDINPLAVELARLKARGLDPDRRHELLDAAAAAADLAIERRRRREGASRRYPREDVELFEPHVLLELDSLRLGIARTEPAEIRSALALVLSSILIKVSRQPGDTSAARRERRLSAGFTTRLFAEKAKELAERLASYAAALPADAPTPLVLEGDARRLEGVRPASIDLVVSSPPYPANYDYLSHHTARLRWLDMSAASFARLEMGARRRLHPLGFDRGRERFLSDMTAAFEALGRVCRSNARVVLIIADSVLAGRAVHADELIGKAAAAAQFRVSSIVSQARPHFHSGSRTAFGDRPRREHALLLRPTRAVR